MIGLESAIAAPNWSIPDASSVTEAPTATTAVAGEIARPERTGVPLGAVPHVPPGTKVGAPPVPSAVNAEPTSAVRSSRSNVVS